MSVFNYSISEPIVKFPASDLDFPFLVSPISKNGRYMIQFATNRVVLIDAISLKFIDQMDFPDGTQLFEMTCVDPVRQIAVIFGKNKNNTTKIGKLISLFSVV